MSSVSNSVKGNEGVRSNNYAGEGVSNRDSKKKESANAGETDKIPNNSTTDANADARHKSKARKGKGNASNDANDNTRSSKAENGDQIRQAREEKAEAGKRSNRGTIPTTFTPRDSGRDMSPGKVKLNILRGSRREPSSFVALRITVWSSWKQILTPLCFHITKMRNRLSWSQEEGRPSPLYLKREESHSTSSMEMLLGFLRVLPSM